MNRFEKILMDRDISIERGVLQVLQINVGRKCNQACRHCHVDAAPWRTETLDEETVANRLPGCGPLLLEDVSSCGRYLVLSCRPE